MSCPNCKAFVPCPVMKSEGNKYFIEHPDIQYRVRKRACSACLQVFQTTECDSRLLEELALRRNEVKELLQKNEELTQILFQENQEIVLKQNENIRLSQENKELKRKVNIAQGYLSNLQNRLSRFQNRLSK